MHNVGDMPGHGIAEQQPRSNREEGHMHDGITIAVCLHADVMEVWVCCCSAECICS